MGRDQHSPDKPIETHSKDDTLGRASFVEGGELKYLRLTPALLSQWFPPAEGEVSSEPNDRIRTMPSLFAAGGAQPLLERLTRYTSATVREVERATPFDFQDNDHLNDMLVGDGEIESTFEVPGTNAIEQEIGRYDSVRLYRAFVEELDMADIRAVTPGSTESVFQVEHTFAAADKVAQRVFAAEAGVFAQPEWVDLRNLNRGLRAFSITGISFTDFPVDEIAATPGCVVFEHPSRGFSILTRSDGAVEVLSEHPTALQALRTVQSAPNETAATFVGSFLEELGHSEFTMDYTHLGSTHGLRAALIPVARQLIEECADAPLYLKSSTSSGGHSILRLSRLSDGQPCLETNSPDAISNIDHLLGAAARAKEWPFLSKVLNTNERPTLERTLAALLAAMENPILEREIPRAKAGNELAEFRLIFQKDPESGQLRHAADYAKVSPLSVAANVSMGGRGERSSGVMRSIVAAQGKSLSAEEVTQVAEAAVADMRSRALQLAERWAHVAPRHSYDFAVDLIPSWSAERGSVDFFLLEIQFPYSASGLKDCDPEAALEVSCTSGKWIMLQRLMLGRPVVPRLDLP